MDVIEIGISQMHENPAGRRVSGVVSLLTDRQNIVLRCETTMPENGRNRAALLQEALRQLGRMPENRRRDQPLQCRLVARPMGPGA